MQYQEDHRFERPIEVVSRMYFDRAFFERKYREQGAWDVEVLEHRRDERSFLIKCRFQMKSDAPIPDFAKKFVSDSISVVQQDSWDIPTLTGRIETELKGMPVRISADMALKSEATGCVNQLKWTVSCSIPLIGGKLEKIIAEDLQIKSRRDQQVSKAILKDY